MTTKLQALQLLERKVAGCTRCPDLVESRTRTVFGEGSPSSRLVFCGEGPGETEDQTGRPFVGRAGKLLGSLLKASGLAREDVYILNAVKCRPPQNRTPTDDELSNCLRFLKFQIKIINPRVIVCLGATAARSLLDLDDPISHLRGRWFDYRDEPVAARVMCTYHPAYLLRIEDPERKKAERAKVWADIQAALAGLQETRT